MRCPGLHSEGVENFPCDVLSFLETRRAGMSKSKSGSKLGYGHGTGIPNPVDVHVGARLRVRRPLLGMSQTTLGDAIGLSFQQVQKYERGANRIGSSRLFDLSRVLDVPIEYFFDDMPEIAASSLAQGGGKAKKPPSYEPDPMARRETLELVRAYYKIRDPEIRKRLHAMIKTLGAAAS